ncbi:hypothetical protein JX266_005544 [Neoarthrinium moseri]|nr:hypothetical protein JX266_005544 [Neoarthrinium moseri]
MDKENVTLSAGTSLTGGGADAHSNTSLGQNLALSPSRGLGIVANGTDKALGGSVAPQRFAPPQPAQTSAPLRSPSANAGGVKRGASLLEKPEPKKARPRKDNAGHKGKSSAVNKSGLQGSGQPSDAIDPDSCGKHLAQLMTRLHRVCKEEGHPERLFELTAQKILRDASIDNILVVLRSRWSKKLSRHAIDSKKTSENKTADSKPFGLHPVDILILDSLWTQKELHGAKRSSLRSRIQLEKDSFRSSGGSWPIGEWTPAEETKWGSTNGAGDTDKNAASDDEDGAFTDDLKHDTSSGPNFGQGGPARHTELEGGNEARPVMPLTNTPFQMPSFLGEHDASSKPAITTRRGNEDITTHNTTSNIKDFRAPSTPSRASTSSTSVKQTVAVNEQQSALGKSSSDIQIKPENQSPSFLPAVFSVPTRTNGDGNANQDRVASAKGQITQANIEVKPENKPPRQLPDQVVPPAPTGVKETTGQKLAHAAVDPGQAKDMSNATTIQAQDTEPITVSDDDMDDDVMSIDQKPSRTSKKTRQKPAKPQLTIQGTNAKAEQLTERLERRESVSTRPSPATLRPSFPIQNQMDSVGPNREGGLHQIVNHGLQHQGFNVAHPGGWRHPWPSSSLSRRIIFPVQVEPWYPNQGHVASMPYTGATHPYPPPGTLHAPPPSMVQMPPYDGYGQQDPSLCFGLSGREAMATNSRWYGQPEMASPHHGGGAQGSCFRRRADGSREMRRDSEWNDGQ